MYVLFGNAAVAYRLYPWSRATNKKIHTALQLAGCCFIVFGLVAVVSYHEDQVGPPPQSYWRALFVLRKVIDAYSLSIVYFIR